MTNAMTAPRVIAPATSANTGREGIRTVTIVCPYCQRKHSHGWPPGHLDPGPRLSHCRTDPRPYYVTAPPRADR